MIDFKKLSGEASAIGKTLELFYNTIGQLKENLKLHYKRGENPRLEVSDSAIGYWFYQEEKCYLGYSFYFIDDLQRKKYILSFGINKGIISKEKIKKIPKTDYLIDDDYEDAVWYYFKIDKNLLASKDKEKELLRYCENIMKSTVKNIK